MNKLSQTIAGRLGPAEAWRNPRQKRFWVLPLVLLYTLLGFVVAPWAIRTQVIPAVAEQIGYPIALEELRINPYMLTVEARGFSLSEADGDPLLSFDRLFGNVQLSSLFRWALSFREITLEAPLVELRRTADGEINLARFLADVTAPGPQAEPAAPETDAALPRLVIGQLQIRSGWIELTDEIPVPEVNARLQPIDVTIKGLSTLPTAQARQDVLIKVGEDGLIGWSGSLQLNPMLIKGSLQIEGPYLPIMYRYIEDLIAFEVSRGFAEVDFDFRIEQQADGLIGAAIDNMNFTLRDLTMTADGAASEFLELPELSLQSGRFLWPQQVVQFATLEINGARLNAIREPDGLLNLQKLVLPAQAAPEVDTVVEPEPELVVHPLQDWTIELATLQVNDFGVRFADQSLVRSTGEVNVSIDATVSALTNRLAADFPFKLGIVPQAGGSIALEGSLRVLPELTLEAAATLEGLPLSIAQPWVYEFVQVEIDAGQFGATTNLTVGPQEPFAVRGGLTIDTLDISDVLQDERLVGWQRLAIDKFSFSTAKSAAEISQINIAGPYARILIAPDQTTNFQQLVVTTDESSDEDAASTADVAAPSEPLAVTIGQITVTDGGADFTDLALPLPFSAKIADLNGQVTTLATTSKEPAQIKLEGRVDEYGLVTIGGRLLPGDPERLTDIEVNFRNLEVPDLSPYTIKFAGRKIADGSLDVWLKYRVEDSQLQGENSIVIRDLMLGDKVDQPDAVNLPLGLAVALLKNPDGTIDIDLPVTGNIDDPEFSVGGVVFRAFVNLITKAVTSPFKMLGGLVGAEEGLDEIEFRPGQSELTPPEVEKITTLTEALSQRPSLTLVLTGAVDPVSDTEALKADRLAAEIDTRLELSADAQTDQEMLSKRQRRVLEQLVGERLPEQDLGVVKRATQRPADPADPDAGQVFDEPAYLAKLQTLLRAAEVITAADLAQLATERSAQIRSALLSNEQISADRVVLSDESAEVALTSEGWIPMKLELDVRDVESAPSATLN